MKVGLIARADRTGLAVQTWSFWRNMSPHRTLIVDLSHCSGQQPEVERYGGLSDQVWLYKDTLYPHKFRHPDEILDAFLDDVDVVFTCETPYNYWLFERAREKGVRTVLQYNYEFLEYLPHPELPWPDLLAAPSLWGFDHIDELAHRAGSRHAHLPVPVDTAVLDHKVGLRHRRSVAKVLHTVGHPTAEDRNGTRPLIEAMAQVNGAQLTVRSQRRTNPPYRGPNVTVDHTSVDNYWDCYSRDVDLFVIPRRFGGLCLPAQEALAQGIPVLMTDCSPQNRWLPAPMLMHAEPQPDQLQTRAAVTLYDAAPATIAAAIQRLVDDPDEVAALSAWALAWGKLNDWATLEPIYTATFANL